MNVNIVKGTRSLFSRDITVGGSQFTDVFQRSLGVSYPAGRSDEARR
jgi:Tfp pilus assembly PilM family ATPase